ncbi:hypothetical protein WI84_15070 [Burkholderia ubonensis]|nr:hypothetical protein WI84_15070 [Burkholderia ubonensis]
MVGKADFNIVCHFDVITITHVEHFIRHADNNRALLLAVAHDRDQCTCLRHLGCCKGVWQVEHPAYSGAIPEYLFFKIRAGSKRHIWTIIGNDNLSDKFCNSLVEA